MDDIVSSLNNAQRAAVTSPASVLQVLAPPGSGKTKTLTARVAYLIAHRELRPWNIITCTFTRKAAQEMKDRIRGFVGAELSKQIKLGTFHAISVQYLRHYGQHIGLEKDFGIADSSDCKAIVKRIITKRGFGLQPGLVISRISAQKVKGIDSDAFTRAAKNVEQQEFAQVFAEYEAELKASNLLDYDDLLLQCCFLMRTHPQCVSNIEAVLIDEFQDTNHIQYDLMGLFAQKRNVITIVGDPDQSIYGFRSAEIQNLARMKERWSDTLTIHLEENYRSSGAILHAAQNIIEQDQSRPPKKLQATHSPGQRPVLRRLPSAGAEASWLVSEIKRMCALTGHTLQYSDFAVLLRSASLSRVIESALGKEGLPYRMVGGVKFYDRAEVKMILDYLRVIHQPAHNEAVERIINVPSRKVGEVTVKSLRLEASSKGSTLWHLVRDITQGRCKPRTKLSAAAERGLSSFVNVILTAQTKLARMESEQISLMDLIQLIAKKVDLQTYLKCKYENEYEARWSNVEELMAQAGEACDPKRLKAMAEEEALPEIEGFEQRDSSTQDLLSIFLANVALSASAEDKAAEGSEPVQQVTISTIHSAKGLEWPVVFVPACYEGSIPHSRADDNDEERRLLYVGMTRAQAMLYLSCPVKNTQREDTTMSSFLTEPDVGNFFEEHGPSMSLSSATALAITLKREPPLAAAYHNGKQSLEQDEDNYWPLNGEEPATERAKWDYRKAESALPTFGTSYPANRTTSVPVNMQQQPDSITNSKTINSGFVSVKAKYEELVEQGRLNNIDRRAAGARLKHGAEAPKGRKRQLDGQGTISTFFSKRRAVSPEAESSAVTMQETSHNINQPRLLQDLSNLNPKQRGKTSTTDVLSLPRSHKVRTAPFRHPISSQDSKPDPSYVFLSSSPPLQENEENQLSCTSGSADINSRAEETKILQPVFKTASTLHKTSVQMLQQQEAPRRRTYGVRPSFNGWANRGRGRL